MENVIMIKLDEMDKLLGQMGKLLGTMESLLVMLNSKADHDLQAKQATASVTQATPAPAIPTVAPAPAPAPVQMAAPVAPIPVTTPVAPIPEASAVVPTATPTYTLEMLATAGSALIDAGKMDALLQLLSKYGVDNLTGLAPGQYGAMATDLRALGARL